MGMLAMATGSVKISHSFSKGSHSSSAISAKRRVHSARYFATWRGHGSDVRALRVYAAWANCSPKRLRYSVGLRSEEHTSELQSLMRISYAVFCLQTQHNNHIT